MTRPAWQGVRPYFSPFVKIPPPYLQCVYEDSSATRKQLHATFHLWLSLCGGLTSATFLCPPFSTHCVSMPENNRCEDNSVDTNLSDRRGRVCMNVYFFPFVYFLACWNKF